MPGQRILEIDSILTAIANQKALDERYAELITTGDRLAGEENFMEALQQFTEASQLKPGESYPKEKITELEEILAEIARQKALDEQYANAVTAGDNLFGLEKYADARGEFQAALNLKPEEE